MRILVTGGAGYIGSVLIRKLINSGHSVRNLDIFMFGDESVHELKNIKNYEEIKGDIRDKNVIKKALRNIDTVVHLAAIVGDAAYTMQDKIAFDTNFVATIKLADMCRERKIKKFIFASTCSVYGANEGNNFLTETSKLNPVSLYAKTKLHAESALMSLSNSNFMPCILRFGTVYGLSPRMRFDLIVNLLIKKATIEKKIKIFGGEQWRPFVHVTDVAKAVQLVLESPIEKIGNKIFNVGSTDENYKMKDIGNMVKKILGARMEVIKQLKDKRSYRVSHDKIKNELNFTTNKTIKNGIKEISSAIKNGKIKNPEDDKFYNYRIKLL
ncbi:MAG: NAD(P)-dependent oxidoreductase [Candidatus Aenigmarchaeota archaeon]|nr:NAD(P)-dependent oxidoreductase [Candidatus Aenigmarchaeota archaeon]